MDKPFLADFFSKPSMFQVLGFLLAHREEAFTKAELARGTGLSYVFISNILPCMLRFQLVKQTVLEAGLKKERVHYQLDEANLFVANLKETFAFLEKVVK